MKSRKIRHKPGWYSVQLRKWKHDIEFVLWQARTLSIAVRHPLVPWRAKLAAGVGVAYIFSPIQLIPTFIPVIGQLDDLCVLYVAMKAVRKWTPSKLMAECELRAGHYSSVEPQAQVGDENRGTPHRWFGRMIRYQ